ncbi:MAG: hypothetical protein HDR46_05750 [Bacteroides sp.]|nr:hypothetical protein [Bacteroides sp.]
METKKCPYCGGEIMLAAKKCKHCGEWVDEQERNCHRGGLNVQPAQVSNINTPITFADSAIQTIQKISLRKWFLIAIGVGILSWIPTVIGVKSCEMLMFSMIFSSLMSVIFIISMIVHLVQDMRRIKIMSLLVVIGAVIGLIGYIYAFSEVSKKFTWISSDWSVLAPSPELMKVVNEYILSKAAAFGAIQSALVIGALSLGISSVNKKAIIPWTLLLIGNGGVLISMLLDKQSPAFAIFNGIAAVFNLIAIIWILVGGNKFQTNYNDIN